MKKLILLFLFIGCSNPSQPVDTRTYCAVSYSMSYANPEYGTIVVMYKITVENTGDSPAVNVRVEMIEGGKIMYSYLLSSFLAKYTSVSHSFQYNSIYTYKVVWDNM